MANLVSRGDIWMIDFDPIIGREQGGIRPGLVFSVDKFNQGPAEGGLSLPSFVKIDDMRSVSTRWLVRHCGRVRPETVALAAKRLGILLGM